MAQSMRYEVRLSRGGGEAVKPTSLLWLPFISGDLRGASALLFGATRTPSERLHRSSSPMRTEEEGDARIREARPVDRRTRGASGRLRHLALDQAHLSLPGPR